MTDGSNGGSAEGLDTPRDTSLDGEHWLQGVFGALARATKQAHLVAYQTGTGVVEQRNGKMGVYPPDSAMYEDLIPPPFVDSYEL